MVVGAATYFALFLLAAVPLAAQPPGGPGGFGPPGMGQSRKIVKDYDKDGDGRLNAEERKAAREAVKKDARPGRGPGGFGPRTEPGKPGPHVEPSDAAKFPDAPLYDPAALRTLFLQFEAKDWEQELQDFHGTDVDVPCTLTVDGKAYPNVGVHFRGMSSYMMVSAGSKRSLNLSLDTADEKQRLYGAKTLNLLNGHEDPSMMSTVLYSHVARKYIPAPKANFVKVVVNGESWGVYASVQQFDKVFLKENFATTKGTRWKVRGSPGGGGGLDYLGDDVAAYRRRYEIKSKDDDAAWKALIALCKTLAETPADKLEAALAPVMDVDGLLWFLALDAALINCDGYWIRASDYSLYLDDKGKFHVIPHDMNEAFRPAQGPGFGGGPGGMRFARPGDVMPAFLQDVLKLTDDQKKSVAAVQKGVDADLDKLLTDDQRKQLKEMRERGPGGGPPGGGPGGPPGGPGGGASGGVDLDPLIGLADTRKPLRSKVLAVPALRAKYLEHIRTIAEESLDWKTFGSVVGRFRTLIEKEVEADTRKLESFDAFKRVTLDDAAGVTGRGHEYPLRTFADRRRKYLLDYKPKP